MFGHRLQRPASRSPPPVHSLHVPHHEPARFAHLRVDRVGDVAGVQLVREAGAGLARPETWNLGKLKEIGIARLLRSLVVLGNQSNPRANERNGGYIMVRKGQGIQVPDPRCRRGSAEESRDTDR